MAKMQSMADDTGTQKIWFASPTGSAGNPGTRASPWDLPTALSHSNVQAGHHVKLLAGNYGTGLTQYTVTLGGTNARPIVISPWNKHRANIRGSFVDAGGGHIEVRGLEFSQQPTNRSILYADRLSHNPCVEIFSPGWRVINCIIRDTIASGIWASGDLTGLVIAGNLIYNCGFYATDGNGYSNHGIYTHNAAGGSPLIEGNVFGPMFSLSGQLFSSGANAVQNYSVRRNTFLGSFAVGSGGQVRNIVFAENRGIGSTQWQFVTGNVDSRDIFIRDNYLHNIGGSGFLLRWVDVLEFVRNTIITDFWTIWTTTLTGSIPADYQWTFANNTYRQATQNIGSTYYGFRIDNVSTQTFDTWKSLSGLDATSTHSYSVPATNVYDFKRNRFSRDRGVLTIHNHQLLDYVTIPTTDWNLLPNQRYTLRQATDPINDFMDFNSSAGSVTIPMRAKLHTNAKPEGWGIDVNEKAIVGKECFPNGAAYLLFRQNDTFTISTATQLQNRLNGTTVFRPGQTLLLQAGTYTQAGGFSCSVSGTPNAKLVVRPEPGAEGNVIIDGGIRVTTTGGHVRFQDLRITDTSWTTRWTTETGSSPALISGKNDGGVFSEAEGVQIINCHIYDCVQGIRPQSTSFRDFVYGLILQHNGWDAPDRGHGHGMYIQGGLPGWKVFEMVMGLKGYSTLAVNFYGSAAAQINKCLFRRVLAVGGGSQDNYGFLIGGEDGTNCQDVRLEDCHSYTPVFGQRFLIGLGTGANNTNIALRDCVSGEATLVRGNWPVGQPDLGNLQINSLTHNAAHVWPNRFDLNRAFCFVYNAAGSDTVNVDLSSTNWANGSTVTIRNAHDYYVDTFTDTIAAGQIAVDMRASQRTYKNAFAMDHTEAAGSGHFTTNTLTDVLFPNFGAFVLFKT